MKKICSGCEQERDIERDFAWKNKAKGTRQRWCKFCQAEANSRHYQNNKQIYLDCALTRNALVNAENKQKLYVYLSSHPCIDCGQTDIRVLEFDHVRGSKTANIARLLKRATSWKKIEAEIAKCEVRCANYHRIKTSERGNWWHFEQS
ncbi:MAG TPA: hypothetical protein VKY19_23635 [Ktedonosporobacter sp.]|jgi:hypothetical protein|nr:hypothetical protein [Ktedonosporobacter sp.]